MAMARGRPQTEHLLRRAGFGATAEDIQLFDSMSSSMAADYLVDYERQLDDVDDKIGQAAYVNVTTRNNAFAPATNIDDARQRWLFRLVHSRRPLQEKMALFWHNHFATAYSKVAGAVGAVSATKMFATKAGELPGPPGQLELFRRLALGSFRELLFEVARDPAMIVWLDGTTNTRQRPQENFGREVMELFTFGIGNYTEQDVYAAARVFTGWNIRVVGNRGADAVNAYYEFVFNPNQHETAAKEFTFPIYTTGSRTIPTRAAADGMQDGIDLLSALARHPQTARRMAAKLWSYFVSDLTPPDPTFVNRIVSLWAQNDTAMRPVIRYILQSPYFQEPALRYTRYSWPVEFVARSIKETGWNGFSVDSARTPLTSMGQTLFEPPDVNGWDVGEGWFSTGATLARMNFASTLAFNQRFNLGRDAQAGRASAENLLSLFLDRLSPAPYDNAPYGSLLAYLRAGATWPPNDTVLTNKAAGLARLIVGSSEYQFM
jgi:uncharacterized protein (DUF1800 family)